MSRAALLLLALAASPLAAQEPAGVPPPAAPAPRLAGPVIQPGDRVRLHPRAPGTQPMVGRWLGMRDGMVRLEVPGGQGQADTSIVALETVALVERSTGRRSRAGAGMGTGAVIGLLVGGVAGFASGDDESGFFQVTAGQKALAGGLLGAGVGLVIGGIVGASSVSDRWEVVPLRPSAAGAGPAVTLRF
ncbi:MAG TPA: hypothetical protein VLA95_09545 [Gemmatimonadales bacterium]|nr:hypothetical protein [Gemmatimonadales bacterium]